MFWRLFRQRRTSLRSLLRAVALAVFIAASCGGGVARAGDDDFCVDQLVQPGAVCYGASHTLTSSRGTNEGSGDGCGGAYNYGSYYCADPTGCHTYNAVYVLTPGIRHRSTTSARLMTGEETYGSTGAGSNCIAGLPFAISGPLEDASSELDGVPVLQRPKVTAPDAVAALVPNADPSAARTFKTSHGSAWVLVDPSLEQVCVVADDNGTGYGVSCQRFGDARDRGQISSFEDGTSQSAAGDVVIALAPEGVDHVTVDGSDGSTRVVPMSGGVAVVTLAGSDAGVTLDPSPDADASVKATQDMVGTVHHHRALSHRR